MYHSSLFWSLQFIAYFSLNQASSAFVTWNQSLWGPLDNIIIWCNYVAFSLFLLVLLVAKMLLFRAKFIGILSRRNTSIWITWKPNKTLNYCFHGNRLDILLKWSCSRKSINLFEPEPKRKSKICTFIEDGERTDAERDRIVRGYDGATKHGTFRIRTVS